MQEMSIVTLSSFTLRKATYEDWPHLLAWRNDAETRRNSKNHDIVVEESHKAWLQNVLSNPNRHLYIGELNSVPSGNIRLDFDWEKKEYDISWTTAPEARGKGVCTRMATLLFSYVSYPIKAEIYSFNLASLHIAQKLGMELTADHNGLLEFYYFKEHSPYRKALDSALQNSAIIREYDRQTGSNLMGLLNATGNEAAINYQSGKLDEELSKFEEYFIEHIWSKQNN